MKLVLKREALAELTSAELSAVNGAQQLPTLDGCLTGVYPTLPVKDCIGKYIVVSPPTNVC